MHINDRPQPNKHLFVGKNNTAGALRISDDVFSAAEGGIFNFTEHKIHSFPPPKSGEPWHNDDVNHYTTNSYGHRSPDFVEQVDMIVAGCSQTYGIGVPDDQIWGRQLADKFGYSYVNLAAPGWSVQAILSSVLAYIEEFGKPKMVVVLIPDFARMIMPLRFDVNRFNPRKIARHGDGVHVGTLNFSSDNPKDVNGPRDKYIKKPYNLYEVLPYEVPFFFSAQALAYLISYCKAAGIELVWSSWNATILKFYRDLSLEGHIGLDMSGFMDREILERREFQDKKSCHSELAEKYGENFHKAVGNDSHMGIHEHIHLADEFYSFIKSRSIYTERATSNE